ncbi:MAG: Lpg1974 family pore-forming outer membrane protein, partial [Rhabdochlamydiaceae bacterium]
MITVRDNFRYIAASIFSMMISSAICADEEQSNSSVRPQAQSRTIDIFADALYWYTSERTEWAFTLTQNQSSEHSSFKTFSFDWAPGYRIGLGYNMLHDQWDSQLSFTWFQSKATDHASGSVTTNFLGSRLSLLEPFS